MLAHVLKALLAKQLAAPALTSKLTPAPRHKLAGEGPVPPKHLRRLALCLASKLAPTGEVQPQHFYRRQRASPASWLLHVTGRCIHKHLGMARNDARQVPDVPCPWLDGLYINSGHGSRGLITAPLSGELIAAWLHNEPLPLPRSVAEACHPNRFMLRELIRGKVGSVL